MRTSLHFLLPLIHNTGIIAENELSCQVFVNQATSVDQQHQSINGNQAPLLPDADAHDQEQKCADI